MKWLIFVVLFVALVFGGSAEDEKSGKYLYNTVTTMISWNCAMNLLYLIQTFSDFICMKRQGLDRQTNRRTKNKVIIPLSFFFFEYGTLKTGKF